MMGFSVSLFGRGGIHRCSSTTVVLVRNALDPVLQHGFAEVHEKTEPDVGKFQVGEKLLQMNWGQFFNRLQFHEKTPIDRQISARSHFKSGSFEFDGNSDFTLNFVSEGFQLLLQDYALDRFQKSGAERHVKLHGGIDHIGCYAL